MVLLAVFGWKGYGWWLQHKLGRYNAELAAHGEKLTVSELLADRPQLKANQVDLFYQAQAQLRHGPVMTTNQPPVMWQILPGKALVTWRRPVLVSSSWDNATNTWKELADELSESGRGIRMLHELIGQPDMDFRVNYAQGFNAPTPGLARLKSAAQILSAAAMVDLRQGDFAAAVTNICAALALSEGMAEERLLICQLVRIAITHIAINTAWEALQFANSSDEELCLLQDSLAKQKFLTAMRQSFEMERVMSALTIQQYREHGGIYSINSGPVAPPAGTVTENFLAEARRLVSPNEIRKSSTELLWQSALSYEDELRAAKGQQVLISACREGERGIPYLTVLSNVTVQLDALALAPQGDSDSFFNIGDELSFETVREIFGGAPQALVKSLNKVQQTDALCSLAIAAVALKRYRLQNGSYPDSLATLVPRFLAAVPIDPVDGRPLRYQRRQAGSFLLYSIGEDGVDDGGDASNPNRNPKSRPQLVRGQDWVWPQSATPEEIKAWEAGELKEKGLVE